MTHHQVEEKMQKSAAVQLESSANDAQQAMNIRSGNAGAGSGGNRRNATVDDEITVEVVGASVSGGANEATEDQ